MGKSATSGPNSKMSTVKAVAAVKPNSKKKT